MQILSLLFSYSTIMAYLSSIFCFAKSAFREAKQVEWVSGGQALLFTSLIVVALVVSSLVFTAVDLIFSRLVQFLLGILYVSS